MYDYHLILFVEYLPKKNSFFSFYNCIFCVLLIFNFFILDYTLIYYSHNCLSSLYKRFHLISFTLFFIFYFINKYIFYSIKIKILLFFFENSSFFRNISNKIIKINILIYKNLILNYL